jgi:uncharacterized membrane protein
MPAFALAAILAGAAVMVTETTDAQTSGMQRRDDRRSNRQTSRSVKHACNASGQSSRSGCRQHKRAVKQQGRPINQPHP